MPSDNVSYVRSASEAVRSGNPTPGGQIVTGSQRYVGPDDELRDLSDRFETAVERSQGAGRTLDALGFAGVGAPLRVSFETDAEEDARADGCLCDCHVPGGSGLDLCWHCTGGSAGSQRHVPIVGPRLIVSSHGEHCYSTGRLLVCGWPEFHPAARRAGASL